MSTFTKLELPVELADRVAVIADARGQSIQAFVIEAIEARVQIEERRRELVASALEAEREVARGEHVYDGDEVLSYLQSKLSGRAASPPSRRKI
jgi:predicted transcriptional regulator